MAEPGGRQHVADVKVEDLPYSEAMSVWSHFARTGGEDKNRMVAASTWILGASSVVMAVNVDLCGDDSIATLVVLGGLGIVFAVVSISVTLMYGGYANRSWAQADAIARARGWTFLLPSDTLLPKELGGEATRSSRRAWDAARSEEPLERLAPVFVKFLLLASVFIVGHIVILVMGFGGACS